MKEKLEKLVASGKLMLIFSFLGLYFISTGTSWAVFSYLKEEPSSVKQSKSEKKSGVAIDPSLPKTEECPINGKMYSKPEREIWEKRRPLTVVIENHVEARPLSGVSKADVVYEAVAEGGITRLLGVFYCGASSQDFDIGVVRSARVYFVDWAAEYGEKPLFLHWGGANNICDKCPGEVKPKGKISPEVDAFKLLTKIGWRNGQYGNDLDGQSNFGYPALVRDYYRLSKDTRAKDEHAPVAHVNLVYEQAEKRGFAYKDKDGKAWDTEFVRWRFSDDKPVASPLESISFSFWDNQKDYDVEWKYDPNSNSYLRYNGGKPFTDFFFDNSQVRAKNVVVQFVKQKGPVDEEKHMFYTTVGKGSALVFQNGGVIEATWEKDTQFSRTKFYDKSGREIPFVRGEIWIEAVPAGNKINY